MDDDQRGTVLKFERAAERQKTSANGTSGGEPKKSLVLKLIATAIIVAALVFAFYVAR